MSLSIATAAPARREDYTRARKGSRTARGNRVVVCPVCRLKGELVRYTRGSDGAHGVVLHSRTPRPEPDGGRSTDDVMCPLTLEQHVSVLTRDEVGEEISSWDDRAAGGDAATREFARRIVSLLVSRAIELGCRPDYVRRYRLGPLRERLERDRESLTRIQASIAATELLIAAIEGES